MTIITGKLSKKCLVKDEKIEDTDMMTDNIEFQIYWEKLFSKTEL